MGVALRALCVHTLLVSETNCNNKTDKKYARAKKIKNKDRLAALECLSVSVKEIQYGESG